MIPKIQNDLRVVWGLLENKSPSSSVSLAKRLLLLFSEWLVMGTLGLPVSGNTRTFSTPDDDFTSPGEKL